VAGHKRPDAPDDDPAAVLGGTRTYIRDFEQSLAESHSAQALVDKMIARRGDLGNRSLLTLQEIVLAGRRPRTVMGCLVGRVFPLGCRGLPPPGWLPLGLAGPAVPARSPGHGCSGGSSPAAGPLAAAGHAFPSPRPVAERTPADHHGGRVMAGDGDRSLVPERGEPVLCSPPGGVGTPPRHADSAPRAATGPRWCG
jgi:hypothetical protein